MGPERMTEYEHELSDEECANARLDGRAVHTCDNREDHNWDSLSRHEIDSRGDMRSPDDSRGPCRHYLLAQAEIHPKQGTFRHGPRG